MLITEETVRPLINENTSAIMAVHIYGRVCAMFGLGSLANEFDLRLIEDCAECHGVPLSGFSDAYCWSFYQNKIVSGEEGGMVIFRENESAQYARMLRCQGFTPDHDFLHVPRGFNARMPNAQAELILQSFHSMGINLLRRRDIEHQYNAWVPLKNQGPRRDVVWVYDVWDVEDAPAKVKELNARGIPARMAFKPMTCQSEFWTADHLLNRYKTNTDKFSRSVLYLPVFPPVTVRVEF